MASMQPLDPNRKGACSVFLGLGYACALALMVNFAIRLGLIHARIPGLSGFSARLAWAAGGAVCFVLAWYTERLGRSGKPNRG